MIEIWYKNRFVSTYSLDMEQYVIFQMSVLVSPSKSLISSRWVTYNCVDFNDNKWCFVKQRTWKTKMLRSLCRFSVSISYLSTLFSTYLLIVLSTLEPSVCWMWTWQNMKGHISGSVLASKYMTFAQRNQWFESHQSSGNYFLIECIVAFHFINLKPCNRLYL